MSFPLFLNDDWEYAKSNRKEIIADDYRYEELTGEEFPVYGFGPWPDTYEQWHQRLKAAIAEAEKKQKESQT